MQWYWLARHHADLSPAGLNPTETTGGNQTKVQPEDADNVCMATRQEGPIKRPRRRCYKLATFGGGLRAWKRQVGADAPPLSAERAADNNVSIRSFRHTRWQVPMAAGKRSVVLCSFL